MAFLFQRLSSGRQVIARYLVCGGVATAVQYSILAALVELGGVNETVSTTIGYTVSGFVNYLLLYNWAFRSRVRHRRASIRFIGLATVTLALNSALFWTLFELAGLWYMLAQVVTTLLILSLTFTINSRYTFTRD
ncbi:MAG: GtrA family protein [Rhodospirillaceae bacterium]